MKLKEKNQIKIKKIDLNSPKLAYQTHDIIMRPG
jgi:hypothetical protein